MKYRRRKPFKYGMLGVWQRVQVEGEERGCGTEEGRD